MSRSIRVRLNWSMTFLYRACRAATVEHEVSSVPDAPPNEIRKPSYASFNR